MNEVRAAEIRRRMEEVRCELGEDVEQIVSSAKTITDWRFYIEHYPWACVGAAAALGYLLVPSRVHVIRPDASALAELAKQNKVVVKAGTETRRSGMGSMLMGLVARAALRGATAFLAAKFTQQVAGDEQTPIAGSPDDEAAVTAGIAG